MSVRATLQANSAFVLRPDDIRRIWALLEDKIGTVEAVAVCADDFEREFETVDALVNYDNFPAREIVGLQLDARTKGSEVTARIGFAVQEYAPYIQFAATGAEEQIAVLKQRVASFLEAIRPWYSGFSWVPRSFLMYLVVCLPVVFTTFMFTLPHVQHPAVPTFHSALLATLIVAAAVVSVGIVGIALNALRKKAFPIGTFALGAGAERYQTRENIRWVVIVGFLVSMAAAVVFALIWR